MGQKKIQAKKRKKKQDFVVSIISEVDWWAGRDQFQQQPMLGGLAVAFLVGPLAQAGVVGWTISPNLSGLLMHSSLASRRARMFNFKMHSISDCLLQSDKVQSIL